MKHFLHETKPDITVYPDCGVVLNGRYQLITIAGTGGMGRVYKALDAEASKANSREVFVAIKVLLPQLTYDKYAIKRLKQEAFKAQNLSHENIINVYDFDSDNRWTYIKMAWLDGCSLYDVLQENPGGLAFARVADYLRDTAEALRYAHQQGIIHRDIKPQNLFLTPDDRVVVIDFGLSHEARQSLSKISNSNRESTSGTVVYMPPEALVAGHKPSTSDDIYGLAATVYESLTGHPPFTEAVCYNRSQQTSMPPRPPALNTKQWQALQAALAFDPDRRPPTIEAFMALFNKPKKTHKPNKKPLVIAVCLALSALGALGVWGTMQVLNRPSNESTVGVKTDESTTTAVESHKQTEEVANPAKTDKPTVDFNSWTIQWHRTPQQKNGKAGFVDKNGRWVIAPQFDDALPFEDNGLARVKVNGNNGKGKYGFIDSTGTAVIAPQFDWAGSFAANGLARVEVNGKYGFIDSTGTSVIAPQFDWADSFAANGLAPVKVNDKYGFIDSTGTTVIAPQFDRADSFAANGLARVEVNGKLGFIDSTGTTVIAPQFDYAESFAANGLAPVKVNGNNGNGKYGFIDSTGTTVIAPQFDETFGFDTNSLAVVLINDKWGFIDSTGTTVIAPQFDSVGSFDDNGLAQVKIKGQWFAIDAQGKCILDCPVQ